MNKTNHDAVSANLFAVLSLLWMRKNLFNELLPPLGY